MAKRPLASTPGMRRVPLCQIIVLAEVPGKGSGGGACPVLPRAAKGVVRRDFLPLLLLSPVKPVPRRRSRSGAWVSLEVRSGGEMLLCQASSLWCCSEITCRGLGMAHPTSIACSFCPNLCRCGWAGSGFGVAVAVGFAVHGRVVAPLCMLYKKSCGSTALSIAQ